MKQQDDQILSGQEREKIDKQKEKWKFWKRFLVLSAVILYMIPIIYVMWRGTRAADVVEWIRYAQNGFKYIPEQISEEERADLIEFNGYQTEPEAGRSDGYLFDYGDYTSHADDITSDDIEQIISDGKPCRSYGHYGKVQARDFMDEIYTRCKANGIDIMFAPKRGKSNVKLDSLENYDVTDVFVLSAKGDSYIAVTWDIGDSSVCRIDIDVPYGDEKYFKAQLADPDSDICIILDTVVELLNEPKLNKVGADGLKKYILHYAEVGESEDWIIASDRFDYTVIGNWSVRAKYLDRHPKQFCFTLDADIYW